MEKLREEILKLKKEKNAIILAHYYAREEIQDIADFVGDSYYLSKIAYESSKDIIVFCGVRFMAQSAKILSRNKKVLLPNKEALCPMALMATAEEVEALKKKHRGAKVVCYINSTSEVKAVSDVCCTSSSAINIVKNLECDEIIFVPDKNLGSYIGEIVKDKKIIPWNGYCYVHNKITKEDVINKKKELGEDVKVLVHPECTKEVRDLADYIGSTGGIIEFATKSDFNRFLVVTEYGVLHELKKRNPNKEFYALDMECETMKKTSLQDVYEALLYEKHEVNLDEEVREKAHCALKRMHELG